MYDEALCVPAIYVRSHNVWPSFHGGLAANYVGVVLCGHIFLCSSWTMTVLWHMVAAYNVALSVALHP